MGLPLVTQQVNNLLVVHFIGRLSLETKPRPKSWPTLSIIWRCIKNWSYYNLYLLISWRFSKQLLHSSERFLFAGRCHHGKQISK